MRVLIVSSPRVGGRNLSKWLSLELNHLWVHEPFHFHNQSSIKTIDDLKTVLNEKKIVVKVNFNDWQKYYFDCDFYSIFDKVISLRRENIFDAAVSYTVALKTKNFTNSYSIQKNWIENNFTNILSNMEYLKNLMDKIEKIENSLQITYENVYYNGTDIERIKSFLDIEEFKYLHMLKNNLRYRNEKII